MSRNDGKALVVLPFKAKPFALLLDFAYQEVKDATILDASKIQSFRPVTFNRKRFQKQVLGEKNFDVSRLGSLRSLLLALILLFRDYNRFRGSVPIIYGKSKLHLEMILQCRLAAYLGDRDFKKSETPVYEFARHYIVCFRVAMDFEKFLGSHPNMFSSLVVYNGREPFEATFIGIAKSNGLSIRILERGSNHSRYQVFETSPHYHPDWWNLIINYSAKCGVFQEGVDSEVLKSRFIESRLSGVDTYFGDIWNKSTPIDFPSDDFIDSDTILYFTSSSTEFSPFPEFNYDVGYLNQYAAVRDLADEVIALGLKLAIRRHPNSVGVDGIDREGPKWIEMLQSFSTNNVKYFGPQVPFNTMKNIVNAKSIFVWKSSIGFESLILGKPTFALATAKWSWNSAHRCWSSIQIRRALMDPPDASLGTEVANKYAEFMASSGKNCVLFKSAHKWGILANDGHRIENGVFENRVQSIKTLAPGLFGLRRN